MRFDLEDSLIGLRIYADVKGSPKRAQALLRTSMPTRLNLFTLFRKSISDSTDISKGPSNLAFAPPHCHPRSISGGGCPVLLKACSNDQYGPHPQYSTATNTIQTWPSCLWRSASLWWRRQALPCYSLQPGETSATISEGNCSEGGPCDYSLDFLEDRSFVLLTRNNKGSDEFFNVQLHLSYDE